MSKFFGIIYGTDRAMDAEYNISGPYTSISEARDAYDADMRIDYGSYVGGAAIIEVSVRPEGYLYEGSKSFLEPGYPIEDICSDEDKDSDE